MANDIYVKGYLSHVNGDGSVYVLLPKTVATQVAYNEYYSVEEKLVELEKSIKTAQVDITLATAEDVIAIAQSRPSDIVTISNNTEGGE